MATALRSATAHRAWLYGKRCECESAAARRASAGGTTRDERRSLQYGNVRVQVIATRAALHFFDPAQLRALETPRSAPYTIRDLAHENLDAQAQWLGDDSASPRQDAPRIHLWTDEDEWTGWSGVGDPVLHIEVGVA